MCILVGQLSWDNCGIHNSGIHSMCGCEFLLEAQHPRQGDLGFSASLNSPWLPQLSEMQLESEKSLGKEPQSSQTFLEEICAT